MPVTAPYGSWASPISAELVSSAGISLEELALDPAYLSVPRPVEFPTENGQTAHALYYPPANPGFPAELYRQRSPIHYSDRLSCPVILLQGLEDAVVPPAQAERMARALEVKGIPYAYLTFEGEQHGFRKASSIRRALEAELYFYSRIIGFDLADPVDPVQIHNL